MVTSPVPDHEPISAKFAQDLHRVLLTWQPINPQQEALKLEYADFVATLAEAAIDRYAGPEHVTASAFIFTPDLTQVLLCFHKKGQFWVQLGGHIDPEDATAAIAATREATEESGLMGLELLSQEPIDLNRHALANAFGTCKVHWDLGYGFLANPTDDIVVSPESEDVAWWPVTALPDQVPHDFPQRLAMALAELKHRRSKF